MLLGSRGLVHRGVRVGGSRVGGSRGARHACRATSRTASSSSLLSRVQIFSHRSGSTTTVGWDSAAQACEQGCGAGCGAGVGGRVWGRV